MKLFNTNFLHNVLNASIFVITSGALAGFDWTMFGITDHRALQISGTLALGKLLINAFRDGPKGMIAPQPPAEEK